MEDVVEDTEGGKNPNCENRTANQNEGGVIKTTAIQENNFLADENKVSPNNFEIKDNYIIHLDDLLITRAGPKNRVVIVCYVKKEVSNLIISDKTIRIRNFKNFTNSAFLSYLLNSTLLKDIKESKMTGMADSQVNISQDKMKLIPIALPLLETQ